MRKASFKTVIKAQLDCRKDKDESRGSFLDRRNRERRNARRVLRKERKARAWKFGPVKSGRTQ